MTAAEPEEQWKQMKTILQETTTEVAGLSTRKHQYWFDEAGKEIPELLGKMSFCHNRLLANLMMKLRAIHSRLSLGPRRMIGGQHFSEDTTLC